MRTDSGGRNMQNRGGRGFGSDNPQNFGSSAERLRKSRLWRKIER